MYRIFANGIVDEYLEQGKELYAAFMDLEKHMIGLAGKLSAMFC